MQGRIGWKQSNTVENEDFQVDFRLDFAVKCTISEDFYDNYCLVPHFLLR